MELVPIKAELKAQLEDYAQRHGKNAVDALDEALGAYFEWERADAQEALQGIRQGYEDVKAGRTRPANQFLDEVRHKHGFPG